VDGRDLYVERQNRAQTALDLLRVDPSTGAARVIIAERQTPWINLDDDFRALTDGTFIWGSARTGSHQIYLYGRDGTLVRAITSGDTPHAGGGGGAGVKAPGVAGVDEERGLVYFMASGETPIERQLYVVSYREPGEPRAVTSGHGWWTAVMPKSAQSFVGYYSDTTAPPQAALYDASGKRLRWIEANSLDASHPFHPYADRYPPAEFGVLRAADGQDLHYILQKPVGFDPARRYPAIVEVYGGPGVQVVTRRRRSSIWRPAMCCSSWITGVPPTGPRGSRRRSPGAWAGWRSTTRSWGLIGCAARTSSIRPGWGSPAGPMAAT
jgi:dipeptidyl-peptidase-4